MPHVIRQMVSMVFAFLIILSIPDQATAYDYPLSPEAIREAYFLGTRQPSLGDKFLADYSHSIPELKIGRFTSTATIETPFTQVGMYASKRLNFSAQNAIKEFYEKPAVVRLQLDICYRIDAPGNAVRIRIFQSKKEIVPELYDSSSYYPATDKHTRVSSIGEKVEMEFEPNKIESSTLLIVVDTPDGQHAETAFDLRALR